jgi:uncharacterized membrane protein
MFDFPVIKALLTVAALGSGIIGGIFFAFSTFIMTSFAQIPNESGISAMNAIDRVILRSWFMPIFVGMVVLSVILVVVAIRNWDGGTGGLIIAGAAIYVLGSFVSTIVFNVPLNDRLATFDGKSAEAAEFWAVYLRDWTFWNHVRTIASVAASGLFIWAIG